MVLSAVVPGDFRRQHVPVRKPSHRRPTEHPFCFPLHGRGNSGSPRDRVVARVLSVVLLDDRSHDLGRLTFSTRAEENRGGHRRDQALPFGRSVADKPIPGAIRRATHATRPLFTAALDRAPDFVALRKQRRRRRLCLRNIAMSAHTRPSGDWPREEMTEVKKITGMKKLRKTKTARERRKQIAAFSPPPRLSHGFNDPHAFHPILVLLRIFFLVFFFFYGRAAETDRKKKTFYFFENSHRRRTRKSDLPDRSKCASTPGTLTHLSSPPKEEKTHAICVFIIHK